MTSYAESTRAGRRARIARRRVSTAGGIVWIAVLAALLGGVVAVNVAVLRLNVSLDRKSQQRVDLQADNARLQSELASVAATPRIQQLARRRLGLVPADPNATTYVPLAP